MGFKILIADSDAGYSRFLQRVLLDADCLLHPAESSEVALQQITKHNIDAAIIDINLPGRVEELLEACLHKSVPIVAVGDLPLEETDHLVEIMYHGIPYVKKFTDEGDVNSDTIISKMNIMLETLLVFSNNKEYGLGVQAGLSTRGYKVFVADQARDLLHAFLINEPKVILVYFPKDEDLQEIARIRKIDSKVPVVLITNSQQDDLGGQINDEATKVITQDRVAVYLEELCLGLSRV